MSYPNPISPAAGSPISRARAARSGMRDSVLDHATNLPQNAIKQKIELASSGRNSDNPAAKRRRELEDELNEIRSKQGAGKNSRATKQDEIKRLDAQIQSRNKELKASRELVGKLDTEEKIDQKIQELHDEIGSRSLRLVEEHTILAQIRTIGGKKQLVKKLQDQQKGVDELQAKIKEIKDSMTNPEAKELSERYTTLQTELDAIKAEHAAAKENVDSLYTERKELQKLQNEKWAALRKIKDEYHQQRKAFVKYEQEQKQKAWERSQAERDRIAKERKLERAQKMLAEASDPAYLDEIRRANSLLQYFDPSFVAEKAPLQTSATNLQAQAERKVDASDIKGVKVLSKKDRDEDLFPAQKKGKKGKKHNNAPAKSVFNCPPSVLEDCSSMGIDPPMSAEEVPGVIEKVKAKLDHWKADQAAQTQKVRYTRFCFIKITHVLLC